MTELLPCPFCGGEAEIVEGMYSSFQEGYAIRCHHCVLTLGASGRLGECYEWSCSFATEAEAIAAWNTRAERTCKVVQVEVDINDYNGVTFHTERWNECSVCECRFPDLANYCPNCGAKVLRGDAE